MQRLSSISQGGTRAHPPVEPLGRLDCLYPTPSDEMQELANANPYALDHCSDDDHVGLGRLLGADAVIDGTFSVADGTVTLVLRLLNTGSGRILVSRAARGRSRGKLLAATSKAAQELAGWLTNGPRQVHSTPRTRNSSETIW